MRTINPLIKPIPPINLDSTIEYQQDTAQYRVKSICKSFNQGSIYHFVPRARVPVEKIGEPVPEKITEPFLTVHGSVQYSFLYRSFVDTPYTQSDFQEHAIQANLNLMFRNRYPMRLNISTRFNNSLFFRDFFDINMHYDKNAHLNKIKQRLYEKVNRSFPGDELSNLEKKIKEEIEKYRKYKLETQEPGELQRTVEARERAYREELKKKNKDSLQGKYPNLNLSSLDKPDINLPDLSKNKNSADSLLKEKLSGANAYVDSLDNKIRLMMKRADTLRSIAEKIKSAKHEKIYQATDLKELQDISAEMGEKDTVNNKLEKTLMSFEKIGIGRSVLDYSELTATNVLLTGVNVEYNNGIYAAVAAGNIDYGFRDFLGFSGKQRKQQLLIGRIGVGDKKRTGVIFSAFTGRKNMGISVPNDSLSSQIPVIGYSIETFFKKNESTGIVAEVAKTTHPVSGRLMANGEVKNLFNYSDNSNLGISLKAQTALKKTNTLFSGMYRNIGSKFQAFNLYANNSDQASWNLKVDQSILRNRISIVGMIRKNDFSNPYTEKDFKTTSILGSIQTYIRFPRLPVLSAGYFPGTQIYVIDEQRLRESAYYILNGSLTHNYSLADIRMVSSLLYNMYASRGTDSGFIAYSGKMMMASHSLLFTRFQLQSTYAYTKQEIMDFYSVESGIDYSITDHLRCGAKAKYNRVIEGEYYLGQSAHVAFDFKGLGSLQFHYDKSYLPTIHRSLFPIQSGRALWYKNF